MKKVLVVYFSVSGKTAQLAKTIATVCGADLFNLVPELPYTNADLNWNDPKSRSSIEMKDTGCRPAIQYKVDDFDCYDTILIGFPIWWYLAPRIIQTFLESYDFSDKTLIPFATSGGSGMGDSERILQITCTTNAHWLKGKCMNANASKEEIRRWLATIEG